jgi:hypothetical protein
MRYITHMSRLAPLTLVACAHAREPAPEDVDGLSRWLFQHFDDEVMLQEGMTNLAPWLAAEGGSEASLDGYVLSDFTAEELVAVTYPDRDLTAMVGVAVPAVSPFDVLAHAELIVLTDQLWNDPSTYEVYERAITGDAEAFAAGSGRITTLNTVDKKGAFGVHIPFTLFKDFAWVPVEGAGSAVVARSWVEEESCAEGGSNCLFLSFSVDLWYGNVPGSTIRMTSSWNELKTAADGLLSDEERVGLMVNGVHDIFENTDELLLEGAP